MGEERPRRRRPRGRRRRGAYRRTHASRRPPRLRRLLPRGVLDLPGQRRPRRRGRPRAPHQALPPDRLRHAAGQPGVRHGGHPHRGRRRPVLPGLLRLGPGRRRVRVHRPPAGLLLRLEAPAGDRHRAGLLRFHAPRHGRWRRRRHRAVPVVPAGRRLRFAVHGLRQALRRAAARRAHRQEDPPLPAGLHRHVPAFRVDAGRHRRRHELRPVGFPALQRRRGHGRRLVPDLHGAVHHRDPALRRRRRPRRRWCPGRDGSVGPCPAAAGRAVDPVHRLRGVSRAGDLAAT
ncbi:phosphoribose diphosphate:decaprenyl-phosphate phosphoribosyltransferase [Corynebacterium humireducens NBRC 106098 = DSM 45392]|uniref:Phosphoribose diphosphate:decaprenyl-phosphate phosphoribosyltransferase n=1 Tax=Corynebacterium humireducens NBRC 106098 = DSM 45392 TaxID=1223515 RepID=A0A0B5D5G4_9CORY|nr:phosphoribose diphosphate:decaprenyl-phosphate phosphoribosyltransferase [Corynebacterium humireducens NBRC 106098 = DSM 45392]